MADDFLKKHKITIGLLAFAIVSGIFTWTTSQTISDTNSIELDFMIMYDPFCDNEQSRQTTYCKNNNLQLGPSIYLNEDKSINHTKILTALVRVADIPKSNIFSITSIEKADINFKISKMQNKDHQLILLNGLCDDVRIEKIYEDFSCVNEKKHMKAEQIQMNILEKNEFDQINFDIKTHILDAKEKSRNSFVEMIQIIPVELWQNNELDELSMECISNANNPDEINKCLNKQQITILGKDDVDWVKPNLLVSYTLKPTTLTQILITSSLASLPIISAVYKVWLETDKNRRKKIEDKKERMMSICDTLKQEVESISRGFENEQFTHMTSFELAKPPELTEEIIKIDLTHPVSFVTSPKDGFLGIVNSTCKKNFAVTSTTCEVCI